jgi:SMI1 / KNR4 family (SUKH-1)
MSILDEIARRRRAGTLRASMETRPNAKLYPPVDAAQISAAETALGFSLPPLLRDIYLTIGNGGFGPGYGLIGVEGGARMHAAGRQWHLVSLYNAFRAPPPRGEPWGEKLLPICSWGCTYYSYLDCALPQAPVMGFDENSHGHGPWGRAFSLHARSFEEWMERWLSGEDLWSTIGLSGEPVFGFEENQQQAQQA